MEIMRAPLSLLLAPSKLAIWTHNTSLLRAIAGSKTLSA